MHKIALAAAATILGLVTESCSFEKESTAVKAPRPTPAAEPASFNIRNGTVAGSSDQNIFMVSATSPAAVGSSSVVDRPRCLLTAAHVVDGAMDTAWTGSTITGTSKRQTVAAGDRRSISAFTDIGVLWLANLQSGGGITRIQEPGDYAPLNWPTASDSAPSKPCRRRSFLIIRRPQAVR